MLNKKAKIFQALSDTNRLRILKMLLNKTLCVCEITAVLKLAPSTVSKHLSILKDTGFIIEEKSGKWVNYSMNTLTREPVILSLITLLNYELTHDEIVQNDGRMITDIDRVKLCCK
ncbi:MAG: metalloregulator ArsR/SmtB family transcription factor [Ignavibacteria bacterium]